MEHIPTQNNNEMEKNNQSYEEFESVLRSIQGLAHVSLEGMEKSCLDFSTDVAKTYANIYDAIVYDMNHLDEGPSDHVLNNYKQQVESLELRLKEVSNLPSHLDDMIKAIDAIRAIILNLPDEPRKL